MANVLQIKNSQANATIPQLSQGELAYSEAINKLAIGSAGGTTNTVIGGSHYVNQLDSVATGVIKGRVTAGTGILEELTPAQVRTLIGFTANVQANTLNQMAAPTTTLSMNNNIVSNVATPVANTDAVTKAYVDSAIQGLDVKASVRVATTANITLSGTQVIDGVSVVASDRVLVKNQTTAAQNGLYVAAAGAWVRSTDADVSADVTTGMIMYVELGTANSGQQWILTTAGTITLGTTGLVFTQFGGGTTYASDGTTITQTGSTFSINTAYTGQSSITTLGSITTGTWNGTTIAVSRGGTGTTTLTGMVKGNGAGAMSAAVAGVDYLSPTSTINGGTF